MTEWKSITIWYNSELREPILTEDQYVRVVLACGIEESGTTEARALINALDRTLVFADEVHFEKLREEPKREDRDGR